MFSLLYLKLIRHPQLGDLEIHFQDESQEGSFQRDQPFSTVIIGNNGTGKSFLLKTVVDIFREFSNYQESEVKDFYFPFQFHLRYRYFDEVYEILSTGYTVGRIRRKISFSYLLNRPFDFEINANVYGTQTGYEISLLEVELPWKMLAGSVLLNDRFPFQDSNPKDMYQYLGVRRTRSVASTKSFLRKSVRYLFEASKKENFVEQLGDILEFMGFEKSCKVRYTTRYHDRFFTGHLDASGLSEFYENWRESTNRNSTPWGEWYYQQLKNGGENRLQELIDYINEVTNDPNRIKFKDRSKSKILEIDFFEEFRGANEFLYVNDLDTMNLLQLDSIQILKKDQQIGLSDTSAGEYHLVLSLLGLFSRMDKNSLILIDEPEISLHPKWQMQYINFLKRMFHNFPSCHFVIASHSHFLISDLEKESSSVVAIRRDEEGTFRPELIKANTYGWSAEQVLMDVFQTASTRNYYLTEELGSIFELISREPTEEIHQQILQKVADLRELDLSGIKEEDPLRIVLDKLLAKF
ncbi:MAG: AAA family ATPase [Bacteroidota bacterium]